MPRFMKIHRHAARREHACNSTASPSRIPAGADAVVLAKR
jgi:hypothetical protein